VLEFDEPIQATAVAEEARAPSPDAQETSKSETPSDATATPSGPSSMFQSLDEGSSESESEDDDVDADAQASNKQWAELSLQLDSLRLAGASGKKGKNKKPTVVLETPEMRAVMEGMRKVEKEYMFNRKDAGA
jgi:ATP-dependent RNA helicase DHX29